MKKRDRESGTRCWSRCLPRNLPCSCNHNLCLPNQGVPHFWIVLLFLFIVFWISSAWGWIRGRAIVFFDVLFPLYLVLDLYVWAVIVLEDVGLWKLLWFSVLCVIMIIPRYIPVSVRLASWVVWLSLLSGKMLADNCACI